MDMFYENMRMIGSKMMDYEVDGVRPEGRQKKTWGDIVEKTRAVPTHKQGRFCGL